MENIIFPEQNGDEKIEEEKGEHIFPQDNRPKKILKGENGQRKTRASSGGELPDILGDGTPQTTGGHGCDTTRPDPDQQPQLGTSGYSKPTQQPPTQGVNR